MEYLLWKTVVDLVARLAPPWRWRRNQRFDDRRVVAVWYWAVLHDRPVSWAVVPANWPPRGRRPLPSSATMSRRLRTPSVVALLLAVERAAVGPARPDGLLWIVDGKSLAIGGASKDRQSGYGRAARGMGRGYKIHALVAADGGVASWRLAAMNVDEREIARRMLKKQSLQGYVLADANYDSNVLHGLCDALKNRQIVAPRRYGPKRGLGRRKQTAGRLRSKDLLENRFDPFGGSLYEARRAVERFFGNLTNWWAGLTHLPPWARGYRRVHRWVQAKLVVGALKTPIPTAACAAS